MMVKYSISLLFTLAMLWPLTSAARFPEAGPVVRDGVVQEVLQKTPKVLLVYAKGLCCPSCAIGIRKKISVLSFVDSTGDNKGVALDAQHQLVTITLKPGQPVDLAALQNAVTDAGYTPVEAYRMQGDKLITKQFATN